MLESAAVRALLLSLAAGLSTLLGALVVFAARRRSEKLLAVSLGFAGGVMLAVSFTDLFPTAREHLTASLGGRPGALAAVLSLAAGIGCAAALDHLVPHDAFDADTGEALLPDQQVETVAVLSLDLHFNVVLVHPERFCFSSSNRRRLEELAKLPLALQVNADTLLRWGTRRQGLELLELTSTPLLGSDCHDMTKRPPNLKGGREMVRRKLGEAFLAQMDENARRLTAPTLAQV